MKVEFDHILENYNQWRRSERFSGESSAFAAFSQLKTSINKHLNDISMSNPIIVFSYGHGNWARIPWVSTTSGKSERSSSIGLHIIYLFRQDMSGFYLTLTQGIAQLQNKVGKEEAQAMILTAKTFMDDALRAALPTSFVTNGIPDLRGMDAMTAAYQTASSAHRFYPATAVPPDPDLVQDLNTLLQARPSISEVYASFFRLAGMHNKANEI